jgi:hypothetical protein
VRLKLTVLLELFTKLACLECRFAEVHEADFRVEAHVVGDFLEVEVVEVLAGAVSSRDPPIVSRVCHMSACMTRRRFDPAQPSMTVAIQK